MFRKLVHSKTASPIIYELEKLVPQLPQIKGKGVEDTFTKKLTFKKSFQSTRLLNCGRRNMDLFKTEFSANTIDFERQGQRGQPNKYIVKYKDKDSKDWRSVAQTLDTDSKIQISNLRNETLYEIKIFGEDTDGSESLLFEIRTVASIASKLLKSAEKICCDSIIYRLCPLKSTNKPKGIQIHEFFSVVHNKEERSLLLLGASGSGKSTLVDAIKNYVTNVSFADNFRFQITDVRNPSSITKKEEDIVCYKIRCQDDFKIGFNLNIIDVPGFERGCNKSVYSKLLVLFQSVQYICTPCFVVQSFCGPAEGQGCILNNILPIFEKDINNVIPLITFHDSGEIKALRSLKDAKVEHMRFIFNNSQLLSGKENEDIWNRRQDTMNNLFAEPKIFVQCPVENAIEVLKKLVMPKRQWMKEIEPETLCFPTHCVIS